MISSYEKFSGVYCSGSFIKSQSALTAMALLFEELYIPNNLELALEFAKQYKFTNLPESILEASEHMFLESVDTCDEFNPLNSLTIPQQAVVMQYYKVTQGFFMHYHELVGPFIKTNILKNGEVFNVELVEERMPQEKNRYKVSMNPLEVCLSSDDSIDLMPSGAVPVICDPSFNLYKASAISKDVKDMDINARALACILAMRSIELVIPPTKPTNAETILEARYKLHDFLPPFWAAMLKLSVDLRKRISDSMPVSQILHEGQELVDTTVLPALIELNEKINAERKDWFHKIIYPLANGVKLLIGNPKLTPDGLARAGIYSSLDIVDGIYSQKRAVDIIKQENSLTYLLKVDEFWEKG